MNPKLRLQNNVGDQDLDWLAFCYVSDELSESDREEFEARLASDAAAQQALIDAVEQTQVIYAGRRLAESSHTIQISMSQRPPARSWLKRPGILFTAAAAMLLVVISWGLLSDPTAPNDSGVTDAGSIAATFESNLAVAWADTVVEKEELMLDRAEDEFFDDFSEIAFTDADDKTVETEDWMFVALTEIENSAEAFE
ncbi:MAG: hypothetical protein P8J27_09965 [Mariniblastus sp.]|nr:hypothetical protein [Mariniblastus sp.]